MHDADFHSCYRACLLYTSKPTIKDYNVDEKYFLETLDEMSEQAFNDQCTGANPRYPLIAELKEIYLKAYYGK